MFVFFPNTCWEVFLVSAQAGCFFVLRRMRVSGLGIGLQDSAPRPWAKLSGPTSRGGKDSCSQGRKLLLGSVPGESHAVLGTPGSGASSATPVPPPKGA